MLNNGTTPKSAITNVTHWIGNVIARFASQGSDSLTFALPTQFRTLTKHLVVVLEFGGKFCVHIGLHSDVPPTVTHLFC
jgi:hypothetical protein